MDFILAFLLIAFPSENTSELTEYFYLQPQMRAISIKLELIEEKEQFWCSNDERQFARDLYYVQQVYEELNGAPLIAELKRFPDDKQASACCDMSIKFHHEITAFAELHWNRDFWRDRVNETNKVSNAWNYLYQAHRADYPFRYRRSSLASLREIIGDRDFSIATMPNPISFTFP